MVEIGTGTGGSFYERGEDLNIETVNSVNTGIRRREVVSWAKRNHIECTCPSRQKAMMHGRRLPTRADMREIRGSEFLVALKLALFIALQARLFQPVAEFA